MTQKVIDTVGTYTTPKLMMQAVDDNFDELYAADAALNKARVYGYLSAAADTTITTAGTFYNIEGTFINSPMVGFSIVSDKLTYGAGLDELEADIKWSTSFSCADPGSTVHVGISINGRVLTPDGPSARGVFCKNAGQGYHLSGGFVEVIEAGETVELQITSDSSGDVITVKHFGATLRRFV